MLIKDLYRILDELAPFSLQEEWDNSGLQIGSPEKELTGCTVCVDLVPGALELALETGANVIVTHHPFFFSPVRRLDFGEPKLALAEALVKNDIALISCHTSLDSAPGGISDSLCGLLGVVNTRPIVPKPGFPGAGMGRVGEFCPGEKATGREFLFSVAKALGGLERYGEKEPEGYYILDGGASSKPVGHNLTGDTREKPVRTVAVCGGAGMDICALAEADACVTAEIKRHQYVEASLEDRLLVDGGHFETEYPGVRDFFDNIARSLGRALGLGGIGTEACRQSEPFRPAVYNFRPAGGVPVSQYKEEF